MVLPSIMSANHDESVFADPDRLDIRRQPNPHLTFSVGIHNCMGAGLARLEARITLRAMLERLRDIQVPDPATLKLYPGLNFGVKALPLTFTPRQPRQS